MELLGTTFLGKKYYASLRDFFVSIWKNEARFRYRVFMPRRCFNLNEIFMQTQAAHAGPYDFSGMISSSALLLESEAVAREYMQTGAVPSILIVDDVIVHGRSLEKVLYDFECAVRSVLVRLNADEQQIRTLHWNLSDAARIKVFIANNERFLLEDEYLYRLESEYKADRRTWQEFSQRISWFIQSSAVANTSFVPSKSMLYAAEDSPKTELPHPGWTAVDWELRERKEKFYFYRLKKTPENRSSIIFSLRSYETKDSQHDVRRHYIPFVFARKDDALLSPDVIDEMRRLIARHFSSGSRDALLPLLRDYVPEKQKLQFFYLAFSAAALNRFFEDFPEDSGYAYEDDAEKIARNFGSSETLCQAIQELILHKEFAALCEQRMIDWLEGYHDEDSELLQALPDQLDRFELNRKAEDYIFSVGLEAEREAVFLIRENRIFYPNRKISNSCSLNSFLEYGALSDYPLYYRLACLLMLMDAGVVSLGLDFAAQDDAYDFSDSYDLYELRLRAGEQALFCKARQLALFIPSMIKIEEQYLQQGKELVLEQLNKFQSWLEERGEFDGSIYSNLSGFAADWYSVGQKIKVWDINLLYSVETVVGNCAQPRNQHVMHMILKQNKIRSLCTEFLDSKHN